MEDLRIIVGAGSIIQSGFISLQESDLDITDAQQWAQLFEPNSIDAIVAEHVFEHLTFSEGLQAARNCYRYLKHGGTLRIAVPDGFHPDQNYIDWVAPGTGYNGDDHKVLFNYRSLARLMKSAGFFLDYKEFWNEQGEFYTEEMEDRRGQMRRTSHDFWAKLLSARVGANYTSLVIDGIKL